MLDGPDPFAYEGEDPEVAKERARTNSLSCYPHVQTGLTFIQTLLLGRRYDKGGVPLQKIFRPFSMALIGTARICRQPLDFVFAECFRLVQQVAVFPMFERLPDYSLLMEILPESAESFHIQRDFLESQELPQLTEFGCDLRRDEVLYELYPEAVCLPLNLVAGIGFDCAGNKHSANFPPHNVSEVIDALLANLENPKKTDAHAIGKILKGPDFAAGGTIISDSKQLANCYSDGEGIISHKCNILVYKQSIHMAVIEPSFALRQLDSAIKQRQITGVSGITKNEHEVVATIEPGADLLSIKEKIHELPGFTTTMHFDLTMTVWERKTRSQTGIPGIDMTKKKLRIDEFLQVFIDQRLRLLREIHEIKKAQAVSRMQNELLEFKRNYGSPRRTQIQTPSNTVSGELR